MSKFFSLAALPRHLLVLLVVFLSSAILACESNPPPATIAGQGEGLTATVPATPSPKPALAGPRATYLALGDSLAYGVQPNLTLNQGYADMLFARLREQGVEQVVNLACPGETTTTMLAGGCQLRPLRKVRYEGSQIDAALAFIAEYKGQVSPVTLTLGVNDVVDDIGPGCRERQADFAAHLQTMSANLDVIIGRLAGALDGQGDLVVTLYYNPFESTCPNTAIYLDQVNGRISEIARRYGAQIADPTAAFAGRTCELTWFCSRRDTHANAAGYQAIADAISAVLP